MKKSSKNVRDQVMGLGQTSMRKSYYRELMNNQKELEEKNEELLAEIERRKRAEEDLKALNEALELKVELRTKALEKSNEMLKNYIDELEEAQNQLIEQEKLASLGTLVRGISHEINTPLGVSYTTASFLRDASIRFLEQLQSGPVSKAEFEEEMKNLAEASKILLSSLEKGIELVNNFKSIASDASHESLEEIKVYDFINMVMTGMVHEVKTGIDVKTSIECDRNLSLMIFPGVLSQLLTILISNTLQHGFEGRSSGQIRIAFFVEDDVIHLNYHDDGNGVDEEILKHVFEPFFTTSRTGKTSGLGLYIAYNLIAHLSGTINCESGESGFAVYMKVPIKHEFLQDA